MSGNMDVKVTVDLSGLERRFSDAELRAKQAAFAQRVGFDMNEHCPVDEGTLRDSMLTASMFEQGLVIWDTPYAKAVLNADNVLTVKNPSALPQWPEATKDEKLPDWLEFASLLFDGGRAGVA